MNIDEILNMIDDMLEEAWSLPFSGGRCVVDAQKVKECIEDIRLNLPGEIKQAKMIVADRNDIIKSAERQAESALRKAEERARMLIAQEEIVKQAQEKAADIIAQAQMPRGFLQDYRYLTAQEGDQTRVIFLDYSGYLFTFRSTLFTGLWVSAVGLLAVFLLLLLLSRRIIRPILESYEKQKRFITDAGHELKTPIAIIQADTDVLTLETGEGNEWIDDIQHQVRRLSTLTNDLIYLSRMEEPQRQTAFLPLPFSDLVAETAQSFQAVAKSQGKTFSLRIQPTLTLVGEEKSLGQLVSILLDNALKYSPPGGEITVTLARQGKSLLLTVANTAQTLSKELLENMFDRFYRGDKARSSEQGGYGIGLSIAKAVVQSHKGKISAAARGDQLVMTVVLPAG